MAEIKLWASDRTPTVVNADFLQRMVNRLVVGYHRYERETPPTQRNYFKRIEGSLRRYKTTKNKEFLIDLANYAMREFDYPHMRGTFFEASESNGRRKKD